MNLKQEATCEGAEIDNESEVLNTFRKGGKWEQDPDQLIIFSDYYRIDLYRINKIL